MKITAIADAFISEKYYLDALKNYPEFELENILFFGPKTKGEFYNLLHTLERAGAEALEMPEGLTYAAKDSEIILNHMCPLQRSFFENTPKLKYVLSCRGGVENINIEAATERKIPIFNNPAHNANAVAEFTVGMMLAETRHIARCDRALRQGKWRTDFPIQGGTYELKGRTVGLIGFGTIGREIAKKLKPFDCNIIVYDLFTVNDASEYGCTQVSLEELMKNSDIISLHARSEAVILDMKMLELMKPEAYLINTARPHLLDEEYLLKMLKQKRIAGAALDVFMREPLNADSPLLKLDNVTITNHIGGATVNCFSDAPKMVLDEFSGFLNGKKPRFCANRKELNI